MEVQDDLNSKKSHRDRHSGRKAQKKKNKKDVSNPVLDEKSEKQRNPKAFAFNSAVRAERRFRRKQDIETKKQHIPLVDRTPIEPPPILVAVVGPPKVGKSTLIKNLIKLFTKAPLTNIKGPLTVVTGKKRRVTFIECNNDINSMVDLAKIADLVLLLCDASFGFEMEIFEFLNICQVHGMPRIMGVLTHLDMIKNSKTLKTTKKTLKHRFWTEVYPGAKLFYLSGILHGEYLRNEIKNLGRFISVMKFRPLQWRSTHSYLIADRYEDLTNRELIRQNPKCDRNISLYGYVRGVPLKKETSVHIAGMGDFKMQDVTFLPDPCPLPDQIKKRALIEKEKSIYSPFSGVGGIVYDKDAVYIELGGSHSHTKREDNEFTKILSNFSNIKETLDVKLEQLEMQLFSGGDKITAKDFKNNVENIEKIQLYEKEFQNNEEDELELELKQLREEQSSGSLHDDANDTNEIGKLSDADFSCSDTDNESEDEDTTKSKNVSIHKDLRDNKGNDLAIKINSVLKKINTENMQDINNKEDDFNSASESEESTTEDVGTMSRNFIETSKSEFEENINWNLAKSTEESFLEYGRSNKSLMKLVYDIFDSNSSLSATNDVDDKEESIGGLFKKVANNQKRKKVDKDAMNLFESSLFLPWGSATPDWLVADNKERIKNCFVTGKWKESEDAAELLKLDDAEDCSDASEIDGDFEDLETGVKHSGSSQPKSSENQGTKRKRNDNDNPDEDERHKLAEKKRKLKEKFDVDYDNSEQTSYYDDLKMSAEKQAEINKTVFENMPDDVRVQIEGFRPGMYIRIEFENVPAEFVDNFDPTYPIVIGSLNMGEENIGYVNVKLKKHRWYSKILKSNDPLIISLGWRRFQTIPLYAKLEDDMKYRYLKYTPQHVGCNAHFWGPITPQGTGFLALQVVNSDEEVIKKLGFRIAATGAVQELDKSTQIMKKLKLIGYPLKIYKKTAFIKGMFNSSLEVAKFEGARIKTVSGIRGQIKKAVNKPEGCFRATFEDKIQLSDIVFCRTWYRVDVSQFYTPVNTLLLPLNEKNSWKGVRTTGEIKREEGIKNAANKDSLYTPIERQSKPFKELIIPQKLQKALPYKDKPKFGVKSSERKTGIERVAVIREPHEQKVSTMMKMIKTSYEHKQERMKKQTKERLEQHRNELSMQEANKERKLKQKKKEVFRKRSKNQIRTETKQM